MPVVQVLFLRFGASRLPLPPSTWLPQPTELQGFKQMTRRISSNRR